MSGDQSSRALRRFVVFVLLLATTVALAYFGLRRMHFKPDQIRTLVTGWGALGPLVYILIFSLRPFIFFPSTVLFIAAGLAFGPVLGTLYAVAGGTAAALISFWLARTLGHEFVQARLPERMQRFQQDSWGAGLVFFLNLVPIVPITAVNYTAGLSRMSFAGYMLAVVAGLTPRAFAYTFFGDSLLKVGSPRFVVGLFLIGTLIVVPTWLHRRYFANRQPQSS